MKIELKSWQFIEKTLQNPHWTTEIKKEDQITVTDFLYLKDSRIGNLGIKDTKEVTTPQITFAGIDPQDGACAKFENCPNLKVVNANFLGPVKFNNCGLVTAKGVNLDKDTCGGFRVVASFVNCLNLKSIDGTWCGPLNLSHSGIEKINNLVIERPGPNGEALIVNGCASLRELSGTFPGQVSACDCKALMSTKGLVVSSPNNNGVAALFRSCESLEKAEGVFHGFVDFKGCNIRSLDPKHLTITQTNKEGMLASFWGCDSLTEAHGQWNGCIDFAHSSIQSTKNLIITAPNKQGVACRLCSCQNLKKAEGTYYGMVDYSNSAIEHIGNLKLKIEGEKIPIWLNLDSCQNLKQLPATIDPKRVRAKKELLTNLKKLHSLSQSISKHKVSENTLEM
jgi:hypothetical protein